jgi:hypothetical protein
MINIYYRPDDGEIFGWSTGSVDAAAPDGLSLIAFDVDELDGPPNSKTQKIDGGKLVEKNAAEKARALIPTETEIRQAVYAALSASDHLMLPDRDDISEETRAAWVKYRKALRGLSKGSPSPTVSDMIANFPVQPDGTDPIADWRKRSNEG